MSSITSSCRFPGSHLNTDWRKFCVNTVPFPRLHFFMASLSPLQPANVQRTYSTPEVLQETLDFKNVLASHIKQETHFVAATAFLRGNISHYEAETSLRKFRDTNTFFINGSEWLKYATCPVTPPGYSVLSALLTNSTTVTGLLQRTVYDASTLFSRRAYLSHYINVGMDEMEISEAYSNVGDLISEYPNQWPWSYEDEELDEVWTT
mmetsp:Transcript_15427/g.21509  ORF Transcript_15427/g.21509 Transcript_15427/m.21509 type:complete len:207 (+) Transcript_15427:2-622(+)